MVLEFGTFRLDLLEQRLTRNDAPVVLRRKTWDVLRYLSERPGKLISREELAERVWGDTVVSDEVVTAAVRELRRALSESGGGGPVIETIRGRGFRFVATLTGTTTTAAPSPAEPSPHAPPPSLVGRAEALQQLHDVWRETERSRQRIVFITGSAGIGKTALVDSFLGAIGADGSDRFAVGRGECGEGDFRPMLQAVAQLYRSARGEDLSAALRRDAPEWISRLGVHLRPADRSALARANGNASNERLTDALLDVLARVAQDFPLVLTIEDLHRCDPRTRALLRRFTQRYDHARMLVVGTYRTDATDGQASSLRHEWKDLVARRKAREIALAPLDRAGVESYLTERRPGLTTARFVDWAYRQSRGNPANLSNVLDQLTARGAIRRTDSAWQVADPAKVGVEYDSFPGAIPMRTAFEPFVGRVNERASLDHAWLQARSGQRRTVVIVGEPGIGKSAIVRRFLEDVAAVADPLPHIVSGKCTEQRARAEAYMPILDMLESWSRDDATGEVAEQLLRLAPHWARQIPGTETGADPPSMLVAIDARPERMMREAAALIEALASARPVVLALEDAHWADPPTIDLLSYLATRPATAKLLILVTSRLAEAASQSELASLYLGSRDAIARMDLQPFNLEEIRSWLGSTFDNSTAVVDHLANEAARRSGGNPLFLQAVTRALASSRCVEQTTEGWRVGSAALPGREVPAELDGLIASQLRLLPSRLRELVEVASVIGDEFDAASVAAALGRPLDDVDAELTAEAPHSFLIASAGTSAWPDGTTGGRYRFRHALYRRALYDALPPHRRGVLHRGVAAAIERGFKARLAPVTTELAEHYGAGGDHSAAATYLERAALLMIERSALREAIAYFERAIEALGWLPDGADQRARTLRCHVGCGLASGLLEGPQSERVQHHTDRIGALLPRVDDLAVIFPSLRLLWFRDLFTWNYASMAHGADELVRRSETQPNMVFRSLALSMRGITTCYRGDVLAARGDLEESLRLCDDPSLLPTPVEWIIDARVETRCYLAWMLWLSGFPGRSNDMLAESMRLAEDSGHESTRFIVLWFGAALNQLRRDAIADAYVETFDDFTGQVGFDVWRQFAAVLRAVSALERGDESALNTLLATIAGGGDHPSAVIARAYLLGQLANAFGRRGEPGHGIALIELALARIGENGARVSESDLLRIRGDLQLVAGDPTAAETSYQAALDVARRQGSRAFELRAATARARLHRGGPSESVSLAELDAIHGTFSDGLDTRDLLEAREVLGALRSDDPGPSQA